MKNKVFNKIFTSIATFMIAYSSVNPISIVYAIDTLNAEETWEVTDFKFNNSILTGLSESGLNKLARDKTIDLPQFNTENVLVTEIGEKAFYDTNLEGINAKGLTNIIVDKSAFQKNNIKGELDLSWVKDVNEYAFADNKIESVKSLPKEIKANSFRDNLIKSLSLSNIIVGEYAFSHNNIDTLTIEENSIIKDGSFSYNNLKSVNIAKSSNIVGNDVFGGNNQFVKIVSENTSIKSAKSTLGFGHVINPPVIRIKYLDSVTKNPLLSDEILGTDLTNEENFYIPETEKTFSAKKIKGYLPVEESKTITITENENLVEFLYNTTKEKLTINASAKSYPLNTTVTEQMLLQGVTVSNSKGQYLQLKVKVDFSNIDFSKQGSYNITYSTEDEFGNSATLESIVNIGLDFGKIELGNGWLVEDFNYNSNTVTGFSSKGLEKLKTNKEVVLPHITSSGAKVTTVGQYAFQSNQLTNVIIPDSITNIGAWAFQHNQLTNIIIPDSVTTIGVATFEHNQLTNVIIPDSVTTIDGYAFNNNKLTNVIIPDSITTIGVATFGSNQLTNVIIPDSVTTIGAYAFDSNKLTNVIIPDSVTTIGGWAFNNNKLTNIIIPDSVTKIEQSAFQSNQLTNVIIPDSVTTIGTEAFNNNKLTNVIIPDSVTTIGQSAFQSNQLTNVIIPDSVTTIGGWAFNNNKLTNVIIPDSVTTIGTGAFRFNQLTNVIIPDSVTTIEPSVFEFNQLTNVIIPDSVTTIGGWAFRFNQLTNVIIPDSVTTIGQSAFQFNQLTNVIIPDSVTTLGSEAFSNNRIGIENLKLSKNLQTIPALGFYNTFIKNLDFSNTAITSIGDQAFSDRQEESYYKVPDTLATIGKNVFIGSARNLPKFYSGKSYVLLEKTDPSPINIDPSNKAIVEWSRAKIKYIDEHGQELIPSQSYYIENNQEQTFVPQPISGYRTPSNISLTATERYKENEVTFVYNKLTEEEIKELNKNTDLLKFNLFKKTDKESYLIGKNEFGTAVSFDLSGFNTALVNPKIKIYYDPTKIKPSSDLGASSLVSSVDNKNGVITLNLQNINSGTKLEYPIYYLFNELVTPQNTDLNISAEFYSDDILLASAKPISFKGHYKEPTLRVRNKDSLSTGAVLAENLVDNKYTNSNQTMTYVYSTTSNRNVSEYTLTQKLPDYLDSSNQIRKAGFDETKNPGWKLSDDGNSVYYTKEISNTNSIPLPELTLEFPNAQLEKNIKLDASISMIPYEKTKEEPIMEATADVVNLFIGDLPEGQIWAKEIRTPRYSDEIGAYFYDTKTDRNKEFSWNLIFSTRVHNITSYKFNDYNLDERMYYTSLILPSTLENTTVRLYDKNDLLLIEKEVKPGETFTFADEYKFSINRIEIEDEQFNSENKSSKTHYIILNSKLKEPQKNHFVDTNLSSANVFKNTASFEGTIENGKIPKSEDTALVTLRKLNQSVKAVKNSDVSAESRTVQDGNIVTFYLGTSLQSEAFEDEFENWRLIDLLPQYVSINEIKLTDQFKNLENPRYKIVDNYNNTGRTAIIFSADKITNPSINVAEVKIQIEADTPEGASTNEVYLGFDNTNIDKINKDYIPNDPNTVYSKDSSSFDVIKIKELTAKKYIKSDTTPWSTTGVETLPNQRFSYKLAIFNNTDESVGQIEIIDVLPIGNDTSILPNQNGDYINRLSEFKNTFNYIENLEEIQDKYNVYYLNQDDPIDMKQTDVDTLSASTKWTTNSNSSTKAIKIVSKGTELEPNQKLEVVINMTAPSESYVNKYAYNTYAYKTSKQSQFIEPNVVYNKVVPYKGNIKIIKKDSKSNELLANAVFGLYDDRNNEIAKGTTNSKGELVFANLVASDVSSYRIRELSAPEGYIKNENTIDVRGYQIRNSKNSNNEYEYTTIVTNNKYIPPVLGSISFTKVNGQGNPLKDVEFTLSGPNNKTYKATSTVDGKVFFGLLPLGQYTIKETNTNSVLTMPIEPITLTLEEQNKDVNLGQVVNDKATVKVSKIGVQDNFTKKELRSVNLSDGDLLTVTDKDTPAIFDLLDENNTIIQPDLTINKDGFVRLENLEFDKKYKLVEKQTPVKYITGIQVTYKPAIENLEFMVEATGNITDWAGIKFNGKEIIVPNLQDYSKSKVIINKSSNDGELLDNVEFTLFKLNEGGEEVEYAKTQTVNGQAVFEDLLFGNYVLKETSTNKNYLLSEKTYRFNISKYNSKELVYEITNDKFNIGITKVTSIIKNLTTSQEVEYKNFITNNSEKSGKTWEEVSNLIPSWAQNLDEEIKKEVFYKGNSKISESGTELLMVLNGASFNLLDEDKNILGTVTSDTSQDYIEFTNVSLDNSKKYYIEEVESPSGYLKLNHLIEVDLPQLTKAGRYEVKENGDKVFNVNIINNKEYGSFFLTKYDTEDGNVIEGIEFTLYHKEKDGSFVKVESKTTNSSGSISFNDLIIGDTYKVKETKSNTEYELDISQEKEFKASPYETTVFYNYKKVIMPTTGTLDILIFSISGLSLILLCSLLKKKKYNK